MSIALFGLAEAWIGKTAFERRCEPMAKDEGVWREKAAGEAALVRNNAKMEG